MLPAWLRLALVDIPAAKMFLLRTIQEGVMHPPFIWLLNLDAFYDVWLLNLAKPRNRDQWLILYQPPEYFAVLFVVIIGLIRIE